jgi:hypothetical protein
MAQLPWISAKWIYGKYFQDGQIYWDADIVIVYCKPNFPSGRKVD